MRRWLNTRYTEGLARGLHVLALTVLVLLMAAVAPSAQAAQGKHIHALVIGIDDYASRGSLTNLRGAVNDARLIASALQRIGVGSLRVLLNHDAHRDAILSAWTDMKRRARPGDTLMVTYAGHGGKEPERVPGSESDGMDEVLLLGGFRPQAPHNYQRIFDYEWRELVEAAVDYNVVLVFDSCYSGSANRQWSSPGNALPSRFVSYGLIEDDMVPPHAARPAGASPAALDNETYIGASQDDQVVVEILIDGRPHGALSHLFARALLGAANTDGDGLVTRGELRRFLFENVRQLTEARQTPSIAFLGDPERPLFPSLEPATETFDLPILAVNMVGIEPASASAFAGVRIVAASSEADLLWDAATMQVYSGLGDIVAEGVSARELQGVIDKWRALTGLKALAEREPLPLRVREGDGVHRPPGRVTIEVGPAAHGPYLTLINLGSTGLVNYLYPQDGSLDSRFIDSPAIPLKGPFELAAAVTSPFGADHLVALASAHQPTALQQVLMRLDGQPAALAVLALLERAKHADPDQELGLLGFYTGPAQ